MLFLHTVLRTLLRIVPLWLKRWFYPQSANASPWLGGELYLNIYRLPFDLILQSTLGRAANEAHGLRIAGSIDGVQTPFLVDHVSTSFRSYILTSWIGGYCVSDIWEFLAAKDKEHIASELRTQIALMRQHTAGHTCSSDPRIFWISEDPRIFSPTGTYRLLA
jgi:hypothetical protein